MEKVTARRLQASPGSSSIIQSACYAHTSEQDQDPTKPRSDYNKPAADLTSPLGKTFGCFINFLKMGKLTVTVWQSEGCYCSIPVCGRGKRFPSGNSKDGEVLCEVREVILRGQMIPFLWHFRRQTTGMENRQVVARGTCGELGVTIIQGFFGVME